MHEGLVTSALAIAVRWRSPPESSPGLCIIRSDKPTSDKNSSAIEKALFFGQHLINKGIATFSFAVNSGNK